MPLIFHKYIKPEGELGIWKIQEDASFFADKLDLSEKETSHINTIKGNLKIEWLASRYLLHKMSGRERRGRLVKDEYGKPTLEHSEYHISLSHSNQLAAVAAGPEIVGVDIQKIVEKMERIAPKFMNENEFASLGKSPLLQIHVYWGAKECLYKSYGKKRLDFKKHIIIDSFEMQREYGIISGRVVKGDFDQTYEIVYQKIDDYLLVYSIEK